MSKRNFNCHCLRRFPDHAALNRDLWWAGLEHQMAQWVCNFLRSILNIIRLLENIRRFCTGWSSVEILAFQKCGHFFVTATALEILSQVLRQNPRFIQTYETFVHMNQSLCTSWCFIKSTKMQITWSWMNIQEWAPELERHRGSKFVWVQFYFHHIGMVPLQVCSGL